MLANTYMDNLIIIIILLLDCSLTKSDFQRGPNLIFREDLISLYENVWGIPRSSKSGSKFAIFVEINLTHLKCVVYLCPVSISMPFCGRFVELSETPHRETSFWITQQNNTEWRRKRHRAQVNNTFEVSQVYFHKDSNLQPLLGDRRIPPTFSYKLIVQYVSYSTSARTRNSRTPKNYEI